MNEKVMERIAELYREGETPQMIVDRMVKAHYTERGAWEIVEYVIQSIIDDAMDICPGWA